MFELDSKRSGGDGGVPGDIWCENGDVEWRFLLNLCVFCQCMGSGLY